MKKQHKEKKRSLKIGQEIKGLREDAGLSQAALGALFNLTGQQIGKYERGESDITTRLYLDMLEELTGDAANYLKEKSWSEFFEEEKIKDFPLEEQQAWRQRKIHEARKAILSPTSGIPVLSRCPAGPPKTWFELDSVTEAPRISELLRQGEFDFALRVQGDSMFPYIYYDDTIVVSPELIPETGDIVVARIGDSHTVKRIHMGRLVRLVPENPKHETIEIPRTEVDILGKVTAVVRFTGRNYRDMYDYQIVDLLREPDVARLAAEIVKMPEEFREALRTAIHRAPGQPETGDQVRRAQWVHKILRRAMDEVDKLLGA